MRRLRRICCVNTVSVWGLASWQVVAMGDGANDIPMIREAGFGIAYRAKPKTEANADACVRFGGLERIRGWFA